MKVCIIQPAYSTDYSKSDEYFERELELLGMCDESMDMIVCPEMCDIPCLAKTKEEHEKSVQKFNKSLLDTAKATAKRCNAMVFINAASDEGCGYRNTTYAINRNGGIEGKYFKEHLVESEVTVKGSTATILLNFPSPL